MKQVKRIYRSPGEAMLGGVCAGLARYASLDVTVVRLATVLLCFFPPLTAAILVAYLAAWVLVPRHPDEEMSDAFARREEAKSRVVERAQGELRRARAGRNGKLVVGLLLVVVGLVLLADRFDLFSWWPFWWVRWDTLWPMALIGVGVVLVLRGLGRAGREPEPEEPTGPAHPPGD